MYINYISNQSLSYLYSLKVAIKVVVSCNKADSDHISGNPTGSLLPVLCMDKWETRACRFEGQELRMRSTGVKLAFNDFVGYSIIFHLSLGLGTCRLDRALQYKVYSLKRVSAPS